MNESFEPITMEELFGKASNAAPQTFKPITMEELFPDMPKQQLNPLKDVTGLGIKQAEDFNRQLASRHFDPVQAYQQFENYGKQMADYYTERGYSPQQIEKIKKEFVASADPRNKTNWWDYYVSDRANDVMVGTGNLLVDALAAVPENIPVLGKLADDAEKYTRDVTQAWQNAVSDKQKIQTYLGERAEKEALANGAGELGGLWANLKENPMQMASLFSQQAPQLALGALGKIPAAITYMMGGAGRVRNDIEQAYDDTYKNNPAQLLQLPEIQSRMKQGMSFEQAVNDAKTDITDNWKSIVAGAAIAGTEAFAPFGKVGQGVNRGVAGTFAKEIKQEAFQEGGEQLNSNLAVGQIDGKTKASDNVVRNAALGGIAGGLTGIPSAIDAYLNRDSGAENLVDQLSQSTQQGIQANEQAAERATQGQDIEIDGVNQQVLEQVVSGISDQDLRDSYYDELKKDIQDGIIEERANSSSTYGKLAREYLQQTQAQAQPEVQLQATHQTDNASHINPEIERVLDLRKRMMDWRAGKKVNNINDLLDTPMSFANQEAKRDFAIERAFGEVQAIAEKYNIDPNDGKAMRQWLEDYIAKRDQAQSEAQAYSQAVNPEQNVAKTETEAETVEPITPDTVATETQTETKLDEDRLEQYRVEVQSLLDDNRKGTLSEQDVLARYTDIAERFPEHHELSAELYRREQEDQEQQLLYSRSPMKSVEANIARGRERMTKAILDKADVKRGMYNHEFGWVDFVWGDDGTTKPLNRFGEPRGRGLSHIFEARMRKDGLTEPQVAQMLTEDIVETIAKGRSKLSARNGNERLELNYQRPSDNKTHRAILTRNKGSNAWVLTGFEVFGDATGPGSYTTSATEINRSHSRDDLGAPNSKFPKANSEGETKMGYDKLSPTHSTATLSRDAVGASEMLFEDATSKYMGEGASRLGNDSSTSTDTSPTLTRADIGASPLASDSGQLANANGLSNDTAFELGRPTSTSQLNDTHAHSQRGRGVVAENGANLADNSPSVNPQTLQDQQALSRLLGEEIARHIEVVDRNTVQPPKDETIESLQSVEGWYIQKTQKAYIYADAVTALFGLTREERLAWVAWHELAHKGLDVKYRNVLNAALQQAKSHPVVATISRFIQEENPKYTENIAIEEALVELYAAYRTGKWDSLNQRYNTSVHPSYAVNGKNDMGSVFQRFVAIMRRLIAGLSKNKRAEMMAEKDLFNLLKRIDGSVMELANSNQTANTQEQSDVRYSLNENVDSDFAKAVDAVANGETVNGYVIVGTTPNVLKMLGLPDVNVTIHGSTFKKVMQDKHNVTAETLKQLPKQINDPVAVMKSAPQATQQGYVILTELIEENPITGAKEPVVSALHLKQDANGLEIINIASVYGKNLRGLQNMLNHDLLYWNNKKGTDIVDTFGLQLPAYVSQEQSAENNIKTETNLSQYQDENSTDDDGNTRYSRKAKKDETPYQRDLMVTHNISADGIMHANKMGGLPYASVAVAKQDNPLIGFGEVTLIGDRHYIDPKGENKAKVFGADIYSPRYPDVTYEYKDSDKKVLQKLFEQSAKEIEDNAFDYNFAQGLSQTGVRKALLESDAVKYQFLKENGIAYEPAYRTVAKSHYANFSSVKKAIELGLTAQDLTDNITVAQHENLLREFIQEEIQQLQQSDSPLVKRAILRAEVALNGDLKAVKDHTVSRLTEALNNQTDRQEFDAILTKSNMRKAVEQHKTAFNQYVENIASQFVAKEKIRKGENRNGEATYMAHTLENVVKKLKKDLLGGESMNYGLPSIRSKVTPKFKSIEDIQKNKDRLVSRENFEKVRDEIEAEKDKLAEDLGVNSWDIDDVLWNVVDENVSAAFHYADIDNTPQNRQLVAHFLAKLEAMPTEYFEGKAKDITQFSDFKGAVIPNNLPKNAYDVLAKSGLKIYEYDPSESGSRTEIIKQATNELDKETEGNVLFSRKQSALEQARNGKADARETLRDEILSFDRETYKDLYNRFTSKVHEAFADSRKPVIDFINRFEGVADNVKQRIVQSMQSAENVRDVQRGVIEENYAKPIIDSLVKLGNKSKLDLLTAKRLAGFWISARWSIQKNQMLLDRAEKSMLEAKDLYDSALQHSQDQAVIDRAELDYIKARNHYNGLKHDVELDLGNDYSNKSFKVGVAGGWSIPEAKLLMKTIEGKLAVNDLQALAEQVYDLNQALLKLDEKSGRYTDEELAEYRSHRQYVPLTGDPSTRTDDIDFIGGVAQKAFNIGRDKALKGRKNSEAEDAFDAMWKNIGKTTQYYGWADFKQELASVFDERVSDLEQSGYSKRDAKNEAAKQLGFNKQGMSGLTRTSDNVLTYKDNGKYYEIQLPATVADALRGDNRESSISPLVRAVDEMFAKPTKLMARGITQLSFDFPIVNMIRDVMGKAIYIAHEDIYDQTGKPLSAAEKYAIGFKVYQKALSHTFNIGNNLFAATFKHAWGAKLKDSGIQGDLKELIEYGGFSNFTNNLARSEADFVKQLKQSSSILSRTSAIAKHLLNTWGGTFDAVSSLVTYKALKDSGIDPKQAAGLVLETANFRKQGAALTNAKNTFMFLQPKMMDAQKMARIMHTKRGALELLGRSVVMAMLYAAIGSLWSYVLGDDAEDEGGSLLAQLGDITGYVPIPLPESVREALKSVSGLTNIKGNFFKLHLGFGMNQIAWNNGFNLVRAIQGEIKPEEAVVNIGVNWIKNFAPVTPSEVSADKDPINKMVQTFTPTALLPIIQSATNHSAFGSAITPTNVNNEELKATQAKPNTAPEWEAMSTWIFDNMGVDLHPETVKHFVNSYGIIFGSARELINVHIENPNRERLGKTQRVPFLTRFIGMPNENSIPNKYYEAVGESKQATARYNRYKEIGDDEKMKETEPLMRFNQLIEQKTKDVDKEKRNLRNALNKGRMSQEVYDRKMLFVRKREEVIQRALVRQYRQDNGLYTKP